MPRNPRPRRGRHDRNDRGGVARAVCAPAALEGAVERQGGELDLARDARARCRRPRRPAHRLPGPRSTHGDRRHGRDALLREAAARDGRHAATSCLRVRTTSSTSARSTTTGACAQLAGDGVRVTVIGGGFIGSEIAAALTTNGCAVTIVFPEAGIGARLFPPELSAFVNDYYREKGVDRARRRARRGRSRQAP